MDLTEYFDRPFRWGRHDCYQFTRECVKRYRGYEFPALEYANMREAKALIERLGGSMRQAINQHAGLTELGPLCARKGDPVLADFGEGETLGVCVGARAAFVQRPRGLVFVSLDECLCGWRVPCPA